MSTALSEFHLIRPGWLLAIIPLVGLLLWFARRQLGASSWRAAIDPALLPYVLDRETHSRRHWPNWLIGVGGGLAILAISGPTWERLPQPVLRTQSALVIALDLSRSMDATDLKPSRLARARFKIADILKQRVEGQTALVIYAGDAFTVTPLTEDTATITSLLPSLNTRLPPSQGSRTDLALLKAEQLLKQTGLVQGDILLVTDGVQAHRDTDAARSLVEQGYTLSILAVGTEDGSPIKLTDGKLLKDAAGNIVIPKLDATALREMSRIGQGIYTRISADDRDVTKLVAQFEPGPLGALVDGAEVLADSWQEQGPWLLVLLLPLAAIAFRRGYLIVLVLLVLPIPRSAQALDWEELWSRADRRGMQALQHDDAEQAASLFTDPEWKAAAQYRAGDFEGTVQSLEGLTGADALYNKGNALANMGRYASEAYERQALKVQPDHRDARYNLEQVREQGQEQPQQPSGDNAQDPSGEQDSESEESTQSDKPSEDSEPQGDESEPGETTDDAGRSGPGEQSEDGQTDTPLDDGRADAEDPAQREQEALPMEPGDDTEAGQPEGDEDHGTSEDASALQATEQWLRRIPDDPGGLLRRKFYYQYRRQNRAPSGGTDPW